MLTLNEVINKRILKRRRNKVMMGVQHKTVGVGFGIAMFMYAAKTSSDPYSGLFLVGSTIGCMLPDIDHDRTRIGRKRAFVTRVSSNVLTGLVSAGIIGATALLILTMVQMDKPEANTNLYQILMALVGLLMFSAVRKKIKNSSSFKWATKHRGLMHTLLMPVILVVASTASSAPIWRDIFLGITIGYCSHLFADMLTVEGCPVLFPLSKKNVRILKLQTKNASTWLAALILAALPIIVTYKITGGF